MRRSFQKVPIPWLQGELMPFGAFIVFILKKERRVSYAVPVYCGFFDSRN